MRCGPLEQSTVSTHIAERYPEVGSQFRTTAIVKSAEGVEFVDAGRVKIPPFLDASEPRVRDEELGIAARLYNLAAPSFHFPGGESDADTQVFQALAGRKAKARGVHSSASYLSSS